MTIAEAARHCSVSPLTFRRWARGWRDKRGTHRPRLPEGLVLREPSGRLSIDDAAFWQWRSGLVVKAPDLSQSDALFARLGL